MTDDTREAIARNSTALDDMSMDGIIREEKINTLVLVQRLLEWGKSHQGNVPLAVSVLCEALIALGGKDLARTTVRMPKRPWRPATERPPPSRPLLLIRWSLPHAGPGCGVIYSTGYYVHKRTWLAEDAWADYDHNAMDVDQNDTAWVPEGWHEDYIATEILRPIDGTVLHWMLVSDLTPVPPADTDISSDAGSTHQERL